MSSFEPSSERNAADASPDKRAKAIDRLLADPNRNVRREAVNALRHLGAWSPHFEALAALASDPDAEVRSAAIKALGEASVKHPAALGVMMRFAGPSLEGPVAPGRGGKPIKVGAAYERDFERSEERRVGKEC